MIYGLHTVDFCVLIAYLVGITVLGIIASKGIHTVGEYFMPRKFGKTMMVTFAFGTGTASDQAVSVAAETFRSGISGIWWQWVWLPATPFYWIIAPIIRRLRAITTADIYELRYSKSVALLFAIVGILGLAIKIGLLLKGSGALIDSATDHHIPANYAILLVTSLFVIYGVAGGLSAAIITDFVQGLLTVAFSFMLLPFVLYAVGGTTGIREALVDRPEMLSLVIPGQIGLFFVLAYSLQALVGIVAQPFIIGVCSAGKTENDCRVGFMFGNVLKRICTAAWTMTALAAVVYYMHQGVDLKQIKPDYVYGDIAKTFLPAAFPGLMGIFLASLMASVMSSCSAMMVSSSALFTQNIYRPLLPNRSQFHYVTVGRITSVLVVAGGVLFAWYVPDVVTALKIWFRIAPMMGIAFWLGLFWRRATPVGAWAVTLSGFAAWYLTTLPIFINWVASLPFAEKFMLIWTDPNKGTTEIYEPWIIVFYTITALGMGIVCSLLTKPLPKERLDLFYALTRTPVKEGEELERPCTLPVGVEVRKRRMLCTAFGLEIPVPSWNSIIGFGVGWVAVILLIVVFLFLIR